MKIKSKIKNEVELRKMKVKQNENTRDEDERKTTMAHDNKSKWKITQMLLNFVKPLHGTIIWSPPTTPDGM